MTRRAGDGAVQQAGDGAVGRWRRGDLRRHGRTLSGGRDERCGHVQAIGRRKLGNEASATATIRVLVEAGLRGKKPRRQVNGPLCFIGCRFVTSCAAMGLDTIDLRTLSFWRPCAAAHPAHGLQRACGGADVECGKGIRMVKSNSLLLLSLRFSVKIGRVLISARPGGFAKNPLLFIEITEQSNSSNHNSKDAILFCI